MINDLIPLKEIQKIELNKSEISIPSSLRYFKKLGFIILILKKCSYAKKASILKLQFFNWGFSSDENLAQFHKIINQDLFLPEDTIHLDPAINRTIEYAVSEKFLDIDNNGKIVITGKGEKLHKTILENENILNKEIEILDQIGRKVSEKQLKKIFDQIAD